MRGILSAGILFLGFVFGNAVQASQAFDQTDESFRLIWDAEKDAVPTEWLLRGHEAAATTTITTSTIAQDSGWVSIVNKNQNGEAISRHLLLSIPDIDNTFWQEEKVEGGLLFRALSTDGTYSVKKMVLAGAEDYRLELQIEIINIGKEILTFTAPVQLTVGPGLGEHPVAGLGIAEKLYSFVQPIVLIDNELRFFEDVEPVSPEWNIVKGQVDWGGLQSRYFALLLKPENVDNNDFIFQTASLVDKINFPPRYFPLAGFNIHIKPIEPGGSEVIKYSIFSGPKSRFALQGDTTAYTEILFAGLWQWMRALSFALLFIMEGIHKIIPSWGLSIILLAIFVRILMYPIARRALMSQVAFAEVQKIIQPELLRIKKEYRGEEQSEKILNLYKIHNVSPLAGLKPLLIVAIQIPIFVALFHVLGQSYELRDAKFLWIATLAEPDRLFSFGFDLPMIGSYFNLLPFLMAFTTLLTIKLSPAPAADESSQRRNMFFQALMAIGFLLLFYPFPAGMVLYWTMANLLHLLQQFVVEHYKQRS